MFSIGNPTVQGLSGEKIMNHPIGPSLSFDQTLLMHSVPVFLAISTCTYEFSRLLSHIHPSFRTSDYVYLKHSNPYDAYMC